MKHPRLLLAIMGLMLGLLIVACSPEPEVIIQTVAPQIVEVTVEVEKEKIVEVAREVEKPV